MADETEKPEGAEPAATAAPAAPAAPPQKSREEILRDPLLAGVAAEFGEAITNVREFAGETTLTIDRGRIRELCEAFKREGFDYLVDLTGVDYSKFAGYTGERFAVVYQLYSFAKNKRLRLKATASDGAEVPSVSGVWKTANWHERETFDMFGIRFIDHPNLERILMWEGFNGHPLRKDFPVRGIDTGARIYPEIFPAGGGPKPGSTGKDAKDVNLWKGEWKDYGRAPISPPPPPKPAAPPKPQIAPPAGSGGGEGAPGGEGEKSATAPATPEPVPSTPPTPAPSPGTPAPTTPAPTTPTPTTPTPTKPAPTPPPSPGTPAPTPSTPTTPDPTTPTTPAPTTPPVVTSEAAKTAKTPVSAVTPSSPSPVVPSEGEEEEETDPSPIVPSEGEEEEETEEGEEEPDA